MLLDVDNGLTIRIRDISAVTGSETVYGSKGPYETDYDKVLGHILTFHMTGGQTFKKMFPATADIEAERLKILGLMEKN